MSLLLYYKNECKFKPELNFFVFFFNSILLKLNIINNKNVYHIYI